MLSTSNLRSSAPSVSAAAATRRTLAWVFVLILLSLTSTAVAAPPPVLPYIPTTILLPASTDPHDGKSDNSIAYIFAPTSSSVDLLALDISATVRASSLRTQTITSGLPFLSGGVRKPHTTAFAPAFIGNNTIGAYVGSCSPGPDKPELWTLPLSNSTASRIWSSRGPPVTGGNSTPGVPSFLGAALSFSIQVAPTVSPASIYVYGGMCPWANTTGSTWTRAAAYSNQMLKLGQPPNAAYNVSPILSKGPPVANAGFSLTALTPSIANRSGIITQSINSVLLGGHTQAAFINMSGAAIWSLPEEVWSFVSIKQPSSAPTELTLRKDGKKQRRELPTEVDSRSGHTAILSGDGNSIVVLGGWVGDTSQAAEPQLAIIEMGEAFDKWRWKIPSAQPEGPGIFGHGATLLPGNVMMVYGGYSVAPLTNSKLKKRQAGGNVPMFLNLTSMTWSGDYTNPSYDGSSGAGTGPGSSESTPPNNSRDIGLGVGLGVGIGGAAAIVVGVLCWRRYRRNRRRNSAVRALAQDANLFLPDEDEMAERAGGPSYAWGTARGPSGPSDWYTGGPDPFVRGSRSLGYESLRGARGPGGPSYPPPMAMRKGVNPRCARGMYVQAPGGPDNGGSPRAGGGMLGSGNIHPIYEADEDDEENLGLPASMSPDSKEMETSSDPFMTPTSTTGDRGVLGDASAPPRSTTPSPEGKNSIGGGAPLSQDREVQDWVSDIDNTDAVLAARIGPHSTTTTRVTATAPMLPPLAVAPLNLTGGSADRRSPTRRPSVRSNRRNSALSFAAGDDEGGRTVSNLSESNRSAFDNLLSRSESVRSRPGTSSGIAALATSVAAAGTARGGAGDDDRRLESSSGSSSGGVSFNTARSSFAAMQAEGPMLLSGSSGSGSGENNNNNNKIGLVRGSGGGSLLGGTSPRAVPQDDDGHDDAPGSPSKSKPRRSWLGSLRRVFSNTPGGAGDSDESSRNESPTSFEGGDYESPDLGGAPSVLSRRKQGREAWMDEIPGSGGGGRGPSTSRGGGTAAHDGGTRYHGIGNDDDDWDIERASERRLVQVMFTVPREPLRVVNAEIEKEEEVEIMDTEKEDEDEDGGVGLGGDLGDRGLLKKTPSGSPSSAKEKGARAAGLSSAADSGNRKGSAGTSHLRPLANDSEDWDPFWDYGSGSANLRGGSGGSGVLARLTPDLVRVPRTSEANYETPGNSSIIIVHDTSAIDDDDDDDDDDDENRNNDNNRIVTQYDRADTPAGQSEGSEYNVGDEKRFSRSTLASTTPSDFLSVHGRRPSTDSRFSTDSGTPHVIMTAEAVRLKRPPTIGRVLEMVERIEEEETRSNSRNSSPLRRSS